MEKTQVFQALCDQIGLNADSLPRLQQLNMLPSPNFGYLISSLTQGSDVSDSTTELLDQMTDIEAARRALFRLGRLHSESFLKVVQDYSSQPEEALNLIGLKAGDFENMQGGFPFPTIRPIQDAIMSKMKEYLLDDGIDNIIIEAPTGVGKSGLAVASLLSCNKGWLVTANKMLQSQYILEFPWMADFRGRSNYSCQNSPGKNCANAGCQNSKGGRAACSKDWGCDYHTARSRAMNSPYTTMNLSALLIHSMYKTGKDTEYELRTPHQRPVLIIDEAHNLPEALTGVIEISISLEKLQKIGLMDIPDFHDPTHYIGFLKQVHELATDALEAEDVRPDVAKELEIIRTLMEKVDHLIKELDENFENWVLDKELDANRMLTAIRFNPIKVDKYWPKVARLGKKTIMLSATIIDHVTYMELLGMDPERTKIIRADSPFALANRPIYTRYMTQKGLNMGNLDANLPDITAKIISILDHYKDYKGIIHGNTYRICLYLRDRLPRDRILFPENAAQQAEMLAKHKRSKNSVLLSPSMTEGVDLKGDLGRFQIIVKMPYPYLGDPLIRKRKELYHGYYGLKTALTLIQAYGRTTRNEEDWSHTFVLDGNFQYFLNAEGHALPEWFKSAVQQ